MLATNCITKIPQDINLQLSADGTLTLKAGSKVYRGNRAVVNITQDISMTYPSSATILVCADVSGTVLQGRPIANCSAGTSDPQTPNSIYYDTANNVIHFYTSQGVQAEVSFPVAICTATGTISSIDQVFNGFGYIGNTMFALPGVSGLIPNGRNADGTLNNTAVTVSALRTLSFSNQTQSDFGLTATTIFSSANAVYNAVDNKNYNPITGNMLGFCNCGTVETDGSGNIISFVPKTTFRALDWHEYVQLSASFYKRTTAYSSEGANATITFETPIAVQEGRYLEVVYTARGKTYTSVIPAVFAPLNIVVGSLNWGGDLTDRDYDCVMNITVSGGYITAFTSSGRDIYIKRVDVVDYYVRS